ncbi:Ubiquinone biosynthesis monooxygenase COQ6, mitochondrial [Pseudolycoriella hygida]|uniref:Ubiquinone biosynthesis monooxygenase COQ6, mitochondrial n=1 Tax=Pseudolycoriella hygida TaxID=35572 RepID=A0A9Q0MXB3_9DIPT|nr:Ubiquinone biosynthesis monooxygenase COQ6, mitochondrial [Pseudolycoriella hygida]
MSGLIKHFLSKSSVIVRFNQQQKRLRPLSNALRFYSTERVDKHYDIVVVGGGPAGISMACSIAKNKKLSDRKVLVLDGAPKFKGFNAESYSNRVYAINKGAVSLMESLDVWDKVTNTRCQPVKQMQVWDACSDAIITLNHEHFSDNMAYIVENELLMSVLLQQLNDSPNVLLKNDTSISSVQLPKDGFDCSGVLLKTGERYSCDLLSIIRSYIQFAHCPQLEVYDPKYVAQARISKILQIENYYFWLVWAERFPTKKKKNGKTCLAVPAP